jgi:outer membrane receptor protein involved in Fe transport
MGRKTWALFIMLLVSYFGYSQNKTDTKKNNNSITVQGRVMDQETGQALEFATVSLFAKDGDKLLAGSITDEQGLFSTKVNGTDFRIVIEYISYEPHTIENAVVTGNKIDIGQITMSPQGVQLEGVEIRAEKSETVFSLDKKVFNVGKDLANRGGTAEDILDNVPSVTVDLEGTVSLRGSEGVRILVDGRPSSLTGGGLKNIAANMIEKVEVITNPSARYEAEGMAGIINIILKKDEGHGFNGSLDGTIGFPARYSAGANLNYRKGRLNWFLNTSYNYTEIPSSGSKYQESRLGEELLILDQFTDRHRTGSNGSVRFGADYFLNDKEKLTLAVLYRQGVNDNLTNLTYDDYLGTQSPSTLVNSSLRVDEEVEDSRNQEYSLNYSREFSSREHALKATLQYTDRYELELSDINQTITPSGEIGTNNLLQYSFNDSGFSTALLQVDYVHPYSETHKWEVGIRSSLRDVGNDFFAGDIVGLDTIPLAGQVNNFLYNEDIHAGYFIYGNQYENFSFQAGIRSEFAEITTELPQDGEDGVNQNSFLQFFPSGHINYKVDDSNSWQLSYSRRINRPRFWDLNPFFGFTDNRNFFGGNPLVNPEFTDSYEVANNKIWEAFNLSSALFYRKTNASIQRLKIVNAFDNTTVTVPLNIGEVTDIGVDINGSYSGIKWLRLDGNFSLFRNQIRISNTSINPEVFQYYTSVRAFEGTQSDFDEQFNFSFDDAETITWNGRLTARFTFWESDLQLRGNYRAPRVSAQGNRRALGSLDIGWSKDFMDNDLTLTFSVKDVFNSRKLRYTVEFEDFYEVGDFQWRSRYASLSANYRINQKKSRGKGKGNYGE